MKTTIGKCVHFNERYEERSTVVFQKVSEDVFAIVGDPARANVTALVLPKRVVLVDCGMQLSAAIEAKREIEEISDKKVEVVILTHFHSDHTHALPIFSDCRIVSSNLLLKNLKLAGRKAPEGFKLTFPNETFDELLEIQDGDSVLVIKRTGGHTDCSTYVFYRNHRTVAAGDNLWTEYYPWGGARGGDPDVWIQTLREYLSLDAEHFIPGHGPVGGKASVMALLSYLSDVRDAMREKIALRRSEEEVLSAGGDVRYRLSGASRPHISTLKKWYRIWRARIDQ